MRKLIPLVIVLVLATAAPAYADDGPNDSCRDTCGGAAFSPALSDSPVTLVICSVPDACKFGPR